MVEALRLTPSATESPFSTLRDISRCGSRDRRRHAGTLRFFAEFFTGCDRFERAKEKWTRRIFSWRRRWRMWNWARTRRRRPLCLRCTTNRRSSGKITLDLWISQWVSVAICVYVNLSKIIFCKFAIYFRKSYSLACGVRKKYWPT